MSATLPTALQGGNNFGGTRFWYSQSKGTAAPRIPREALVDIKDVPWGSRTVVQVSGTKSAQLTIAILVRMEDVAALYGKVGQSGALVLIGDSSRNATLLTLTSDFSHPEGFSEMSATWLVRP